MTEMSWAGTDAERSGFPTDYDVLGPGVEVATSWPPSSITVAVTMALPVVTLTSPYAQNQIQTVLPMSISKTDEL